MPTTRPAAYHQLVACEFAVQLCKVTCLAASHTTNHRSCYNILRYHGHEPEFWNRLQVDGNSCQPCMLSTFASAKDWQVPDL